jgi:hypothetical protein
MAAQPERHASVTDPKTWSDYGTALGTVQAGRGDGLTFIQTKRDKFGSVDMDHCRNPATGSVDIWAQLMLEQARLSYAEITPSGTGLRIWGIATGDVLHRKFSLDTGDNAAVELFRGTNKALTISGLHLQQGRSLSNIDSLMDWCVFFGEKHKLVSIPAAAPIRLNGNGSRYGVDEIEQFVRGGAPADGNRSNLFHAIVGHYVGCGWDAEQITAHIGQFPDGIGGRYLSEGRLRGEVDRSVGKYNANALPASGVDGWASGWETKAPQPDPKLDDIPEQKLPDPELDENNIPEQPPPWEDDPQDLNDDELDSDDDLEPSKPDSGLPPLYAHGDPDPRPVKSWLIKRLIPASGHGLLSGQWGTYKTFVLFDLFGALMTGQPFLGHTIKRQCGVLLIAAEGGDEIRLRLDAMVREKCGGMARAPIRWYEAAPLLLEKGATDKLIAMAREAEASLQKEFGLPLGMVAIDTVTACAGYSTLGAENDIGIGQAIMNILKAVAQALNCFALGVGHLGKDVERGTRGAGSKEDSGDVIWYCLGDKALSGAITNTRLAVRKHRGGKQGQQYPFVAREIAAPELDEDGEPVTTLVINWQPAPSGGAQPEPEDPWAQGRRQDQRTAVLRLKRVLMSILADQGVELPIPPDGPTVRMVEQEIVRTEYFTRTPVDGTPEQKRKARHMQFSRALAWAEDKELIGVEEIDDVTYLRLTRPDPEDDDGEEPN